ncbi:MAG: hypothetical protein CL678_07360 [Bdellovibrionaceae bacterium]|nr:hypothetical protein [Pseudobdellovibrionaceae bacterium]|tara:strand:+ start:4206 stop:4847 length:642 start_codon:yes stop_codon:yes gene_type:complete
MKFFLFFIFILGLNAGAAPLEIQPFDIQWNLRTDLWLKHDLGLVVHCPGVRGGGVSHVVPLRSFRIFKSKGEQRFYIRNWGKDELKIEDSDVKDRQCFAQLRLVFEDRFRKYKDGDRKSKVLAFIEREFLLNAESQKFTEELKNQLEKLYLHVGYRRENDSHQTPVCQEKEGEQLCPYHLTVGYASSEDDVLAFGPSSRPFLSSPKDIKGLFE